MDKVLCNDYFCDLEQTVFSKIANNRGLDLEETLR